MAGTIVGLIFLAILSLIGSFATYGYEGNTVSMIFFILAICCFAFSTVFSYFMMKTDEARQISGSNSNYGRVKSVNSKTDVVLKVTLFCLLAVAIIQAL